MITCDFCDEVKHVNSEGIPGEALIQGERGVFICAECVDFCAEIVKEYREKKESK